MTYPVHVTATRSPAIVPERLKDLGPERARGFNVMHRGTALHALGTRSLPTTREMMNRPAPLVLGDPDWVWERLRMPMP